MLTHKLTATLLALVACAALYPAFAVAATNAPAAPAAVIEQAYILGVGDTIQIDVHLEPDLSLQVLLTGDGTIDYPFLGQVQASGQSVAALQRAITQGLKNGYLVNPQVRVTVVSYRPIYITGAVIKAGGYPYVLGLTVEKAIAMAGGLNNLASDDKIYILPEHASQKQRYKASMDTPVKPGQTIIVEEGLF